MFFSSSVLWVFASDARRTQVSTIPFLRSSPANGDQYEGGWVDDCKHGPGRYFYLSTRKLYEGEWADDTPRCGAFGDIPPEYCGVGMARARAAEDHFVLPPVRRVTPAIACACVCVVPIVRLQSVCYCTTAHAVSAT